MTLFKVEREKGSFATISADSTYRYDLVRHWPGDGKLVLWVMLNPSTADALVDDPTIRRCIGFSNQWGARGIVVVNLFALRATDPKELARHRDPIGPDNDSVIDKWLESDLVGTVVEAWGANLAADRRYDIVHEAIVRRGRIPMRLGTTRSGAPKHPLYVRSDTVLVHSP